MPITFHPLELRTLASTLRYAKPGQSLAEHVTPTNPAMDVMTDLSRVTVTTTPPGELIDNALRTMISEGVRLLLVENPEGDVIGLITATDIQGEKPMKLTQETGIRHTDILVRDIMTPIDNIEVMDMHVVRHSHVGDIVRTLAQAGRLHTLVVEQSGEDEIIRGIFSASQIGQQMGVSINLSEKAQTFAELEMAIAS